MNIEESCRTWVPEKKFGIYIFGYPINSIKTNLCNIKEESDDFWLAYKEEDADDLRIYTENGLITCIGAYEFFYYRGKNLIGVLLDELLEIIKAPYNHSETVDIIEEEQTVYKFDALSLVVWVKEGRVVSVQCSEKISD